MDEATLGRIFEPFFTTRSNGNGLGLATARDIVREHDGALEVRSVLGSGTRFDIWLPSVPSHEPIPVQHASSTATRGVGEPCLCLKRTAAACCGMRKFWQLSVMSRLASQGRRRPRKPCAVPARFDAALVCHQPGATFALDFATALRDLAPNLPIILATSSAGDLDAPSLAASGVSEVVNHPLTSAELAGALSRCLATSVAPLLQSYGAKPDALHGAA